MTCFNSKWCLNCLIFIVAPDFHFCFLDTLLSLPTSLPIRKCYNKICKASSLKHITFCLLCAVLSYFRLFATLWTIACEAPLSMGFSRQEDWSELPCLSPGDLPDPGIKPVSLASPVLAGDSIPLHHLGWEGHKTTLPATDVWAVLGTEKCG